MLNSYNKNTTLNFFFCFLHPKIVEKSDVGSPIILKTLKVINRIFMISVFVFSY